MGDFNFDISNKDTLKKKFLHILFDHDILQAFVILQDHRIKQEIQEPA